MGQVQGEITFTGTEMNAPFRRIHRDKSVEHDGHHIQVSSMMFYHDEVMRKSETLRFRIAVVGRASGRRREVHMAGEMNEGDGRYAGAWATAAEGNRVLGGAKMRSR